MSQQAPVIMSPEGPSAVVCRHHWAIQPADGPVSEGVCLLCGEVREFKNFVEGSSWADEKPVLRSSAGGPSTVDRALVDYLADSLGSAAADHEGSAA